MKTRLFLLAILATGILFACNKDKFTTEPQVKVKSVEPGTVEKNDIIRVEGSFTDREGDLDSVYIVYKWYEGDLPTRADTFRYSVANLEVPPNTKEGLLTVTLSYGIQIDGIVNLSPTPSIRDTTATFGFCW